MQHEFPVLVLGGTGHFGRQIVGSLAAKGIPVRVLTRSAIRARTLLPASVQILEGDLTSRAAVADATRNVSRMVISVSAFNREHFRRMWAIERDAVLATLEEARRAGVRRVVYLSAFDLRMELAQRLHLDNALIELEIEDYLRSSGFNWTVIGAPPSMEIFFAMTHGSRMIVPGGGPKALPTISPVDMGEIVAQAVLRNDLGGRRLRVSGPEVLSFREAARRLSKVCGRRIHFVPIPLVLPWVVWHLTRPLARFSSTLAFVHAMLGFIRLLNSFPHALALNAMEDHKAILSIFSCAPMTLEQEAQRRMAAAPVAPCR